MAGACRVCTAGQIAQQQQQRRGTECVITIKGWNCSEILVGFDPAQDWSEEKLMTRTVTFDGVEDGDLHADDFMVDLVRK